MKRAKQPRNTIILEEFEMDLGDGEEPVTIAIVGPDPNAKMTGAEAAAARAKLLPEGKKQASLTSVPKDWRPIARKAMSEGWCIFVSGRGKLEWRGPKGQRLTTPSTPGRNGHVGKNYIAEMRRAGVPGA